MSDKVHVQGLGICSWMFLIFVTLKLCKVIDWSWWWVTAPLWGSVAVVGLFCVGYIAVQAYLIIKGKK